MILDGFVGSQMNPTLKSVKKICISFLSVAILLTVCSHALVKSIALCVLSILHYPDSLDLFDLSSFGKLKIYFTKCETQSQRETPEKLDKNVNLF